MKQLIISASTSSEMNEKIKKKNQEGYDCVGSHQVHVKHVQHRYRGNQKIDEVSTYEYTQSMRKTDRIQERLTLFMSTYPLEQFCSDNNLDIEDCNSSDKHIKYCLNKIRKLK